MARDYRNIEVYHLAYNFVLEIYKSTKKFPKSEEQNIVSQIKRASVSIPLNIAEGSAKAGAREFAYFLNVAYASAKEVEVLLKLSRDLDYLNDKEFDYLAGMLDRVNANLFMFLRNIEGKIGGRRHQFFKKFEQKV